MPAVKKVGILVVAYNAAGTLARVLDRIPREFVPHVSEILVSDDSSGDSTYLVGVGYQHTSRDLPLTIVRQPRNLGYGGNQKVGYEWAIEQGLDIVVMLHGDGQYAPEHLPRLVEPLEHDKADAVFGSRMLEQGAAPARRYAALQVRRQPHPQHHPERARRRSPERMAQRVPRVQRGGAARHPVRRSFRRLRLRHPDHPRTARGGEAHRRGTDPDLLRRRDLLRERRALRQGRHAPHGPPPSQAARPRLRRARRRRAVRVQTGARHEPRPHREVARDRANRCASSTSAAPTACSAPICGATATR